MGSQFKDSLNTLVSTIETTRTHYVRCIKPNQDKAALILEPTLILHQLRCSGLVEATKITAMGLPNRLAYVLFIQRYEMLVQKKIVLNNMAPDACKQILEYIGIDHGDYKFGKTKIFMKAGMIALLEETRAYLLSSSAVTIQKNYKRYLIRKIYQNKRKLAICLQRAVYKKKSYKRYLLLKEEKRLAEERRKKKKKKKEKEKEKKKKRENEKKMMKRDGKKS